MLPARGATSRFRTPWPKCTLSLAKMYIPWRSLAKMYSKTVTPDESWRSNDSARALHLLKPCTSPAQALLRPCRAPAHSRPAVPRLDPVVSVLCATYFRSVAVQRRAFQHLEMTKSKPICIGSVHPGSTKPSLEPSFLDKNVGAWCLLVRASARACCRALHA